MRAAAHAAPNHREEAEGRRRFAEDLRAAGARVLGPYIQRLLEHCVCQSDAHKRTNKLRQRIRGSLTPRQPALRRIRK